jgi:hypothetical protein
MAVVLASHAAAATDWDSVPVIQHKDYQAVTSTGGSAYNATSFPIRLRGVVLNNNEDWLNPTSDYCTVSGHPWTWTGGEAEFHIQAVNLDGTIWDPDANATFNDFGGTSSWLGQNYGNTTHYSADNYAAMSLPWNYTEPQWYDELDRLQFSRPGTPLSAAQMVRAGDLVEVRASIGLAYKGKMNVNEKHSNSPANDFEVVILDKDYGLPIAAQLALSELKNSADQAIFDATRQTGGERYQSSLVTLENVRLADTTGWGTNSDLTLTDATGRTLGIHLGLNDNFTTSPAPTGFFNVTGILDQADYSGMVGYRLLAMNAGSFVAVPEPGSMVLLAIGAAAMLLGWAIRGRAVGYASA